MFRMNAIHVESLDAAGNMPGSVVKSRQAFRHGFRRGFRHSFSSRQSNLLSMASNPSKSQKCQTLELEMVVHKCLALSLVGSLVDKAVRAPTGPQVEGAGRKKKAREKKASETMARGGETGIEMLEPIRIRVVLDVRRCNCGQLEGGKEAFWCFEREGFPSKMANRSTGIKWKVSRTTLGTCSRRELAGFRPGAAGAVPPT